MIDQVAVLPAYLAAAGAVLVLLADLLVPGRRGLPLAVAAVSAAATGAAALWLFFRLAPGEVRGAFCVGTECSYLLDRRAAVLMAVFALVTVGVAALSAGVGAPPGEYAFLLACS